MTNTEPTPDTSPEAVEAMCERLAAYRPQNEWGDGVRHVICDEAAAMLRAVAGERDTWRDKYNALAESALKHVGELGRDNGRKDVEIDAARASQKAAVAEAAALREALHGIETIIRDSIIENDGPNRLWLDGKAHEGPVVDWLFRTLRKFGDIATNALKENHDD